VFAFLQIQASECDQWNKADFDSFIAQEFSLAPEASFTNYQQNLNTITKLQSCQARIDQLGINSCIERLYAYMEPEKYIKGSRSTIMSDLEYDQSLNQEMTMAPEIFRQGLPKNWKEVAKQNNWKWVYF